MAVIHKLQVGQKLYIPGTRGRGELTPTVFSVGRKFAAINNGVKIDMTARSMQDDHGREVFLSRADYIARTELRANWLQLAVAIGNTMGEPPLGCTVADIDQARAILNLRPE